MKESNKMSELYEWLETNKIQYKSIDKDVVDILGFGKAFFQDTEDINYNSIFRRNKDGELIFNSMEDPEVLMNEGIGYIVFKFGNNFYYYDLKKDFALSILKYVGQRTESKSKIEYINLGCIPRLNY